MDGRNGDQEARRSREIGPLRPSPIRETLGIRYLSVEPGCLTAEFEPGQEYTNANGTVQGGILCSFLDHIMGQSGYTLLSPDDRLSTVEISLRFLEAVGAGLLRGRGRVVKKGQKVLFAEGEVFNAAGGVAVKGFTSLLITSVKSRTAVEPGMGGRKNDGGN